MALGEVVVEAGNVHLLVADVAGDFSEDARLFMSAQPKGKINMAVRLYKDRNRDDVSLGPAAQLVQLVCSNKQLST